MPHRKINPNIRALFRDVVGGPYVPIDGIDPVLIVDKADTFLERLGNLGVAVPSSAELIRDYMTTTRPTVTGR